VARWRQRFGEALLSVERAGEPAPETGWWLSYLGECVYELVFAEGVVDMQ
jgi:hypothetical protein